jgi:tRNA threonylcarbamoyladenosine biosynthesis protein TsaE
MPTDDSGRALRLHLADDGATRDLGGALAKLVAPGMTLYLSGELGAGKTTLARGLIHGLGYEGRVKSPTYSLVELYVVSGLNLYHFDFYRFTEARELRDAGLGEYFNEASLCLVEWPERARELLPAPDLAITLEIDDAGDKAAVLQADDAGGRIAILQSATESGQRCITALQRHL